MGLDDKLKASVEDLKEKADSTLSEVAEAGENLKDTASEKIQEVSKDVEGTVSEAVDSLKDSVDKVV